MAKEVYKTRARETGALILLYDAKAPDNTWDATNGRWIVLCDPHHEHIVCEKQSDAYKEMVTPSKWCGACEGLKKAGKKLDAKEAAKPAKQPIVSTPEVPTEEVAEKDPLA